MKLFRVIYVTLNIIIISQLPQTTEVFSGSLLMFGLGMLYDYLQVFLAKNCRRDVILGGIGATISAIVIFISIIGFMECIELVPNTKDVTQTLVKNVPLKFAFFKINIKFIDLMKCLFSFTVLAGIEFFFPVKRPRIPQASQQPA